MNWIRPDWGQMSYTKNWPLMSSKCLAAFFNSFKVVVEGDHLSEDPHIKTCTKGSVQTQRGWALEASKKKPEYHSCCARSRGYVLFTLSSFMVQGHHQLYIRLGPGGLPLPPVNITTIMEGSGELLFFLLASLAMAHTTGFLPPLQR